MTDYLQQQKEQIARINAETAHDFHRIEFKEMCAKMIEDALRKHDQQIQVDVQTTLNGKPTTMRGLVEDVRKQVYEAMRKAFRK